ncbi:MAG: tetratricopeptide repeat protein [bacterium]|nr:tetratricopeptide repeat protein [bacterium]
MDNEEEFEKILASRVENLEKLLRYDLAARYLEKAIRVFPDTVSYYDDLAFALLQLSVPDKTGALRMQLKALEMDPDNDFFINNLGWVYLMMGNYKDAEAHFQKAMEFDPDNPSPFKNMDAAEYMHKHRLNYFEYLVRPADMRELRELMKERHVEDVIALCGEYNADRVEAFKIHHLRKKALPPHEILNALQLVEYFMNEVAKAAEDEVYYDENEFFLYDNIDLFYKKSRKLFYWFIVSSDIVDGQFLEEVGHALKVFYDFLSGAKLVSSDRFTEHLASITSEFAGKLEEYHRLRHDVTLEEDDRETAIDRLFRV